MSGSTIILIITLIILVVALIGTGIGLPLSPLVLAGVGIYGVLTDFEVFKIEHLIIFTGIIAFALLVDGVASVLGAKKFGATRNGLMGAFLGGVFGFLSGGPFGILIGSFAGSVSAELIAKRRLSEAVRAGAGAVLGFFVGTFLKTIIVLSLIIWFLLIVF